jgi:hypothetical protein
MPVDSRFSKPTTTKRDEESVNVNESYGEEDGGERS